MKSKDYPRFEQKRRAQFAKNAMDLYELNLLGGDFDAVLGLLPLSVCCLVALGRGCPAAPGEADFWFEDCCD